MVNAPPTWVTRTERARRKREARRACYEELQRLVGPPVEKLVYLRVLDSGMCSSPGEFDGMLNLVHLQSWLG